MRDGRGHGSVCVCESKKVCEREKSTNRLKSLETSGRLCVFVKSYVILGQ